MALSGHAMAILPQGRRSIPGLEPAIPDRQERRPALSGRREMEVGQNAARPALSGRKFGINSKQNHAVNLNFHIQGKLFCFTDDSPDKCALRFLIELINALEFGHYFIRLATENIPRSINRKCFVDDAGFLVERFLLRAIKLFGRREVNVFVRHHQRSSRLSATVPEY